MRGRFRTGETAFDSSSAPPPEKRIVMKVLVVRNCLGKRACVPIVCRHVIGFTSQCGSEKGALTQCPHIANFSPVLMAPLQLDMPSPRPAELHVHPCPSRALPLFTADQYFQFLLVSIRLCPRSPLTVFNGPCTGSIPGILLRRHILHRASGGVLPCRAPPLQVLAPPTRTQPPLPHGRCFPWDLCIATAALARAAVGLASTPPVKVLGKMEKTHASFSPMWTL